MTLKRIGVTLMVLAPIVALVPVVAGLGIMGYFRLVHDTGASGWGT